MIVDCMTCPVRGRRCEDCVVTVLLASGSAELLLDAAESRAVSMFVGAGLVNAGAAAGLCAGRESVEHRGAFRDVG
jgi:hypothetical protein